MVYEIVIVILLAVICFLLYKLYRIKYTGPRTGEIIPESWKRDLSELGDDKGKALDLRFDDINSRISEIERKVERTEKFIEKLIKEIG